MEVKTFWISWTFEANYSDEPMRILARTPEEAVNNLFDIFSDAFREKATVCVYDTSPVRVVRRGVVCTKN